MGNRKRRSDVIDLTGRMINAFSVLEYDTYGWWKCRCECGKELYVRGGTLRSGRQKSCGCLQYARRNPFRLSHPRLYSIWNKHHSTYCAEWQDRAQFVQFVDGIGGIPYKMSLVAIDPSKPIGPDNFQLANKIGRVGTLLTNDGVTSPIKYWAKKLGISRQALHLRLQTGAPLSTVLTRPKRKGCPLNGVGPTITHEGQTHTLIEWSRITGIPYMRLYHRLRKSLSPAEILMDCDFRLLRSKRTIESDVLQWKRRRTQLQTEIADLDRKLELVESVAKAGDNQTMDIELL